MRTTTALLALLGLALAPFAAAADTAAPAAASAPAAARKQLPPEWFEINGQKYVLVSQISTVETNREFDRNMQIVRAQYTECKKIEQALQGASINDRSALSLRLSEASKALEQNNQLMLKTYAVSVETPVLARVDKSRIYAPVSEADYNKAKDAAGFKAENYIVTDKVKLALRNTIAGVADNFIFREDLQITTNLRQRVLRLTAAVDQATEEADKAKLRDELKKAKAVAEKNDAEVTAKLGFSVPNDFAVENESVKLFVPVTKETFDKWKAETEKPAADKAPAEAPAAK